jgi:V8-like Glu-specific endopeptidase
VRSPVPGLIRISTALCLGALALGLAPAPSALAADPAPVPPATASADPSTGPDTGPDAGNDPGWTSADAEAFWTPALMASAVPETAAVGPAPATAPASGDQHTEPAQPGAHAAAAEPERATAAATVPRGTHFAGVPSIGTLYYLGKDQTAHNCTASVVKSPGKDLILTAGHCAPGPGGHTAFVPQYDQGKEPFGIWAVTRGYTVPGHSTSGTASNLDFAFGVVADRNGRKLEDVTGGNTLTRTPGYTNQAVTVIGYPGKSSKDEHDQPIRCTVPTDRLPGAGLTQLRIACDGFWDGVSGGPWLTHFNGSTGDVIGNVGGLNGGGLPNSNDTYYDRFSYSPVYGDQIFSLYQQATTGSVAPPPPTAYSMGDRSVWRNARHVVAGNFTGRTRAEDMVTIWVDGEVTLYHGDGNSHFTGETQLVAPKSLWKDAVSVTAGTFTPGSNRSGLVVRWIDGELDLYPDVSAAGIGEEVRLENTNSAWTRATVAAGQFGGNGTGPTALVVAWGDGHVSEFPDIAGSHSMAGEVQMIAANKTWTWMRGIAAGDLAGNNGSDLVVRWLDGTLTLYPDVDAAGTHQEITLLQPNAAWTTVTDMTVGNFSANGWPDDLVALFPDGQLTLYPDSGSKGLGAPVALVG